MRETPTPYLLLISVSECSGTYCMVLDIAYANIKLGLNYVKPVNPAQARIKGIRRWLASSRCQKLA